MAHLHGQNGPINYTGVIRLSRRLWELFDAGEVIEDIADGYDMSTEFVRGVVAYEEIGGGFFASAEQLAATR